MTPTEYKRKIRDILEHQASADFAALSDRARSQSELRKWSLVHKYVHHFPFKTRQLLSRSDQWREALNVLRDLGETELIDWMIVQIEVARNLERGIQDLRPRKNGPCHPLVLEYVANRKRKALAVLHFASSAEEEGCYTVDSNFHARTRRILDRHDLIETDEDGDPIPSSEPMARS